MYFGMSRFAAETVVKEDGLELEIAELAVLADELGPEMAELALLAVELELDEIKLELDTSELEPAEVGTARFWLTEQPLKTMEHIIDIAIILNKLRFKAITSDKVIVETTVYNSRMSEEIPQHIPLNVITIRKQLPYFRLRKTAQPLFWRLCRYNFVSLFSRGAFQARRAAFGAPAAALSRTLSKTP